MELTPASNAAGRRTPWRFTQAPHQPRECRDRCANRLAESLGRPFYDLDEMIESQAGAPIPQIFAAEGEAGFRHRESEMLRGVIHGVPGVVALGGVALLHPENRQLVEGAEQVLCLSAPFEAIISRLENAQGQRPLLDGDSRTRLQSLLEGRAAHYASFPLQLNTDGHSPEQAIWQAQMRLGLFHVSGMGAGYDVRVAEGCPDQIGSALQTCQLKSPLALVSDDNVAMHRDHERSSGTGVQPVRPDRQDACPLSQTPATGKMPVPLQCIAEVAGRMHSPGGGGPGRTARFFFALNFLL